MRLSWNEIRARAARFAEDWADAHYEKGETQTFYNDFFNVFGVQRRKVASFEEPVKLLGARRGFIDLFWKGVLLVEQKSAGLDLARAKTQALDYFPGLKDSELPRFILVSDFQTFELFDLDEDESWPFHLADLPDHVEHFGFIVGVQKRAFRDQDPVNIEASELMGKLHDALKASGYEGHDLERLLVRLVFCLFAEDTGIFDRDQFLDLIQQRSQIDGSDTGRLLNELFDVLNKPEERRQKHLDADLAKFPYINGDLFADRLPTAAFDYDMRSLLIEACGFKWDAISPAIFGSLFQSVMNKKQRRASGAHYTTEKNILKVIEPLFLDDLRAEFVRLKGRRDTGRMNALKAFHEKLARLKFLDPACGCGNFLIIAYRELRALEIELLKEIRPKDAPVLDVASLSLIDVNQFYGIEIGEFPVRIAEVALWMMDHIMNNRLSLAFGEVFARIPLKTSPHIHQADALEVDWTKVLPPQDCSFVMGNPPFAGKKEQSAAQKSQVRKIFGNDAGGGEVDYVACWFVLAAKYMRDNSRVSTAFVATKSICQGEQVAVIWPLLIDRFGLEIFFAHRTFEWTSEGRHAASVHVVIVGIRSRQTNSARRLFDYRSVKGEAVEIVASRINPYLVDADNIIVRKSHQALSPRPQIQKGSEATDFGHLTLDASERTALIGSGVPEEWIRPFVGGDEYINALERYCLWLIQAQPQDLRGCVPIRERLRSVASARESSTKARTVTWARYSHLFSENRQPSSDYLIVPKVSSQTREYIPIGFLSKNIIVSGSAQFIQTQDLSVFTIITSRMHMCWMRTVGGRTKSDYQYTNTLVYNTFPWPAFDGATKQKLEMRAQAVLEARTRFPHATLADLYDPDTMPPILRKAHASLDIAVDRLYRAKPFDSDRERVEHLFGLYEKLVTPLTATPMKSKRGRPRAA